MEDLCLSRSGHLVDPELHGFLAAMPVLDLSAETLPSVRALWHRMSVLSPLPNGSAITRNHVEIPRQSGEMTSDSLLYRPQRQASGLRAAILNIHGGGYVFGSPAINDSSNRCLCEAHDCIVLAPAYRLAPEAPYPGGLEDCYAALDWLFDNADALGIDPRRIVVSGESAGGGLAAALCLLARDRMAPPIAGQFLLYPMLDDRTGLADSSGTHAGEFVWTGASNRFGWSCYLPGPSGGNELAAYASPARTEDLSGLPPTFLATGALDLFVGENIAYGRRLIECGVRTEMHVYAGAFHGFDLAEGTNLARKYRNDRDLAIKKVIAE